jgi:hypothetical protein
MRFYQVGIIGSATRNYEGAKDIDVLFIHFSEFSDACIRFGVKYQGWDAHNGHIRITKLERPEIDKPIQLINLASVSSFEEHPHQVLLPDGSLLNEGHYYVKEDGWKYDKVIKLDRRKESKQVIAMDFDGTIRDWGTSKPLPGVKDAINLLREHGFKVLIHSANTVKFIEQWMNDNDIRYDGIWSGAGKPVASIYVDDRGFKLQDWSTDLAHILETLANEGVRW